MLMLKCPYCQAGYTDDFECLDGGRPDTLRCENPQCGNHFTFLFHECLACGEESVFTWKEVPQPAAVAALFCDHCGAPFNEVSRERQDENAAQHIQ